ncbi:hypothetical protein V8F06_006625 [Rhypophila decipiens]
MVSTHHLSGSIITVLIYIMRLARIGIAYHVHHGLGFIMGVDACVHFMSILHLHGRCLAGRMLIRIWSNMSKGARPGQLITWLDSDRLSVPS